MIQVSTSNYTLSAFLVIPSSETWPHVSSRLPSRCNAFIVMGHRSIKLRRSWSDTNSAATARVRESTRSSEQQWIEVTCVYVWKLGISLYSAPKNYTFFQWRKPALRPMIILWIWCLAMTAALHSRVWNGLLLKRLKKWTIALHSWSVATLPVFAGWSIGSV